MKLALKIILSFLFSYFPFCSLASENNNSIWTAKNDTILKLHVLKSKYIRSSNHKKEAESYKKLSQFYSKSVNNRDSIIHYIHLRITLNQKLRDSNELAYSYMDLGNSYMKDGNFDSTLFYYLEAQKCYKNYDPYMYAHTYSLIGYLFFTFDAYNSALRYYRKSYQLKKKMKGVDHTIPFEYWSLAEAHYALNNQDSAMYYYRLSSKVAAKTRKIPYYGNEGIAQIMINKGEYDSALLYLKPIPKWYFGTNVPGWIADMGLLFMRIYTFKNNQKDFQYWRYITQKNAFSSYMPEQQRRFYEEVSQFFKQTGQTDSAYFYLKKANELWKNHTFLKASSNLDHVIEAFNSQMQQNEMLRLTSSLREHELNYERASHRNWFYSIFGITSVIVAALLVWILYLINRQRKKLLVKSNLLVSANQSISEKIQQLRNKEFRIREMQMSSNNLFVIIDKNLNIIQMNEAMKSLFNNKKIEIFNSIKQYNECIILLNNKIKDVAAFAKVQFQWEWKEEESRYFECSVINLLEDPSVKGYVLEGKDITEQIIAQEKEKTNLIIRLDEKEKLISEANREAAFSNLQLALKKDVLNVVNTKLDGSKVSHTGIDELKNLVKQSIQTDKHWENFILHFNASNFDFFEKLRSVHPKITINEEKHCAFIKMKLSNKEVAALLGVEPDTVKKARQRLKKRINLKKEESLKVFLNEL